MPFVDQFRKKYVEILVTATFALVAFVVNDRNTMVNRLSKVEIKQLTEQVTRHVVDSMINVRIGRLENYVDILVRRAEENKDNIAENAYDIEQLKAILNLKKKYPYKTSDNEDTDSSNTIANSNLNLKIP